MPSNVTFSMSNRTLQSQTTHFGPNLYNRCFPENNEEIIKKALFDFPEITYQESLKRLISNCSASEITGIPAGQLIENTPAKRRFEQNE